MLAKMRCRGHALSCFLDALPSELIPEPARRDNAAPASAGDMHVNTSFHYSPHGEPPDAIRGRLTLDGLLGATPMAWTEDAGTGIWMPFWARGEWIEIIASLQAGRPAPTGLSASVRRTLADVGVLVSTGGEQQRRDTWERICADAAAQFRRHGYVIVRDLLHPVLVAALRRYYRGLVAGGRLPRGDDQVAERYRLHSEPVATFFHPQLAILMSRIATEPVKPSYLYFACYPAGSTLPKHVDRLQCEFSISLLIDYSPEPRDRCGWPLFLEHPDLPGGAAAVDLAIGDAVLYRGRELAHYREPLADGHQSSSLFFHYVREDFAYDTF